MPSTTVYTHYFDVQIPPDGHCYLVLGPHPLLGRGAVTATAQAVNTLGLPDPPVYLEVIQMATRRVNSDERYLDIVVRNNAHLSGPPSGTWTNFILYTSVTKP